MNANDPNVVLLEIVAEHLGDELRAQMVFVGGAIAGLLITDPAMPSIRPTDDVDLLCQAASHRTCAPKRRFAAGESARSRWM